MKKLLTILSLLFISIYSYSQDIRGGRIIGTQAFYFVDRWMTGTYNDTSLLNGVTDKIVTPNAIYDFVVGRVASASFPNLTGDVTTVGTVSTMATVNATIGNFGSSTSIPTFTVNEKGLITLAGSDVVIAPAGTLSGATLAANVLASSLTSVGTIATGVWNGTAIGFAYGGTGLTTLGTAGQSIRVNAGATGYEFYTAAGSGTVTNVATGYGLSGGPITTTGTLLLDSATVFPQIRATIPAAGTLNLSYDATNHEIDISGGGTSAIIPLALDDGATEGLASFTAADFTVTSGNVAIDYANGQAATGGQDGFLQSADWTTFNNKLSSVDTTNITDFSGKVRSLFSGTAPIVFTAGVISITQATTSTNGYLSSTDWNTFNNKGAGTVTTVSVVTANGVSGSVATATTTPAITITLGAITPTTVNGNTITTGTGTLTLGAGKTLTASNTITFTATDGSTLAIGAGGTLGSNAYTSTTYAPVASPTFTGTVTIPTPFTLGAVSVLPTGTELNFVDGVTSAIQTQLDGKQPLDADLTTVASIGTSLQQIRVNVGGTALEYFTASGGGTWGSITGTLSDQTDLQSALDLKATLASPTFTGTVTIPTPFTLGAVSVLPTGTELNFVDGVTSSIQTQLDAKAPLSSPTFTTSITGSYLTASEILITDGSKNIVSAPVATYPSLTELTYVKGVTSSIQTQLDSKGIGTVTSVSGTTDRITSTGGATPVIDISATFEALLGKVASPLSQFAATTSAQLAGVISDETGTDKLVFNTSPGFATAANPISSDGAALGTTTLMWSDLFLASGSVINFNNGDVTMTHTSNALTVVGGVFEATGGFFTHTTNTGGNFGVAAGTAGALNTNSNAQVESAAGTGYRAFINGSTTYVIPTDNYNYASFLIGINPVTEGTSGKNHPLISSLVIRPPAITVGAATVTTTATVYIEGPPLAVTTNPVKSLWVKSGLTLLDSLQVGAISTLAGVTATTINKVTITAPTTSATLTLVDGSSLITVGAFATTLTSTATTNVTLPTTGTLATLAGTETLTNKRWTARVGSTTSSATPTINTDNTDIYKLTAQTVDITSFTTNLSGVPVDGDILEIQVTGTAARAITWGASFVSSTVTLPTTTVTTATLTVVLQYFVTSSYGANKWVCVNSF